MVREDRVREILADSDSLQAAVDRLVEEANETGGRDNITVVSFRLGGDGASPAVEDTITGLHRADVEAAADAPVAVEAEPPPAPPAPAPARARSAGRRAAGRCFEARRSWRCSRSCSPAR